MIDKKLVASILVGLTLITISGFAVFNVFINAVDAGYTELRTGQKLVTAKGTPVQMTNLTMPREAQVTIKAMNTNTEKLCMGYSSATALNTNTDFFSLYPGESVTLDIYNNNLVWIDGASGEGVEYIVEFDQ